MKYQTYPAYKDSGVEWLGDVPEHWEIWKLSHAFEQIGSGTTPKSDAIQYYEGGTIAWVNTGDLNDGELFDCEKKVTELALRDCSSLKIFPENSLVIAMYGATIGKLALLRFEATVNQACCVFCESLNIQSKFLFYSFIGVRQHIVSLATGGGQPNISQDILRSLKLSAPEKTEQQKIAQFLDHETAKIDTLIEKQQRLIELLKEKRQAVISHAVTKGLNPNAPMKDSGVEWLGEVPEHWVRTPLKYITKICYGIGEPPKYTEDGVALVRATNIRSGRISDTNLVFVHPNDIPANRIVWLDVGDIIVVRSGAGTGDSSIIPSEYKGSIAGFDMVVKPIKCVPAFLGHVLLSHYVRNNQMDLEKTRAAQPHLNAEELGYCFILLPPKEEQFEIQKYIERELLKFDLLINQSNSAIELMQERRTALISAAVTGKIDVREWKCRGE